MGTRLRIELTWYRRGSMGGTMWTQLSPLNARTVLTSCAITSFSRRILDYVIIYSVTDKLGACSRPCLSWYSILEKLRKPDTINSRVFSFLDNLSITARVTRLILCYCNHILNFRTLNFFCKIMWYVDPLLCNDREIWNYTTAVTRQRPVISNRGAVFSVRFVPRCYK
jgi:hypothetical protein